MPRRSSNGTVGTKALPAFHTGTSSEYDGRRALPKVVRQRPLIFILGPPGVGKTKVALRLAQPDYGLYQREQIHAEVVRRLEHCAWNPAIRERKAVVLELPYWLDQRHGMCRMVAELLTLRAAEGLRTIVCQPHDSNTIHQLLGHVDGSRIVVLGLRFPAGPRGKRRVALRMALARGLPPEAARGTEALEPWNYARVLAHLEEWQRSGGVVGVEGRSTIQSSDSR